MGEVYRAQDTKLGRQVAIKILPDPYASDPERVARFQREAQAVAALNHPAIAAIFEFADTGAVKFLVLELVEGETLAERIGRGALPAEEALAVAKQILEALEAAHEKGVCHRDLKPANVKLTADGKVKVLDFGLAKFMQTGAAAPPSSLTHSPTLTLAGTLPGIVLGTAGYMSPEQAKGFEADQRSDIFSFGCILYELLTGRRAFDGDTTSEILASVLKVEVDYGPLPPRLNPRLVETLRRCLEKNPKKRWHAAGDVRLELESVMGRAIVTDEPRAGAAPLVKPPLWKRAIPVAAALVAGAGIAGYAAWRLKPNVPRAITRFVITLPDDQTLTNTGRKLLDLSPDGSQLVYSANQRLFLRSLSTLEAHPISGSEGGSNGTGIQNPAFSPDGQSVAFYSIADRAVKRLALSGGAPVTVCTAGQVFGLSWGDSGIVFGQNGQGILRVSATGGTPELIAAIANDETASSPQMLPGGKSVLFSVKKLTASWTRGQVVAQTIGGTRTVLVENASDGRYLPTGHLVYMLEGVLLAVPFDPARLTVSGGPVSIVEGVRRAGGANTGTGAGHFAISSAGTLAYLPGPAKLTLDEGRDLGILDRKGSVQPLKMPPDAYSAPRVSPDGKTVAVAAEDDKEAVVWVYDVSGDTARRRLTFGGKNRAPIWSPDGQWIAFQSDREGDLAIFRQRADGSGTAERVTKPEAGSAHTPQAWSPDRATLLFSVLKDTTYTLATMAMKDRRVTPLDDVHSTVPTEAIFSPDGKWIVYQSLETRTNNGGEVTVFVEPFPRTGAKYLVPQKGGHPFWIQKTGEIVLNVGPASSRSLLVTPTVGVVFGKPRDFPRTGIIETNPATTRRNSDPMPDGERIVGVATSGNAVDLNQPVNAIVVVLNWFDELRQRAPVK